MCTVFNLCHVSGTSYQWRALIEVEDHVEKGLHHNDCQIGRKKADGRDMAAKASSINTTSANV